MKKILFISLALLSILNANAQKTKKPIAKSSIPLKNGNDSLSYALGMSIGESLKSTGATDINTDLMTKAMKEVFANTKTIMNKEQANMTVQQKLQEYNKKKGDAQKQACQNYLDLNKKRKGITELPNGLQYEVITAGNADGIKPKVTDTVVVNYVGTLMDGTEFDNSIKRGQPATFPVNGVIKGWTQILQLMPKGASWKVYIPSELAYGENPPSAQIPPNSVLIFEIVLLDVKQSTALELKQTITTDH